MVYMQLVVVAVRTEADLAGVHEIPAYCTDWRVYMKWGSLMVGCTFVTPCYKMMQSSD